MKKDAAKNYSLNDVKKLEKENYLLKHFTNQQANAVLICTDEFLSVYSNLEFEKYFGISLPKESNVLDAFKNNISASDYDDLLKLLQELPKKTKHSSAETKELLIRKKSDDSSGFYVKAAAVFENDNLLGYEIQLCPLSQSECKNLDLTNSILKHIPLPIFYKDSEGRYLGCNAAFEKFTGVKEQDILGKTVFEVWDTERARVYHEKDQALLKNPELQAYDFQVKDAEGNLRDVIFNKAVYFNPSGQQRGILGAYTDITESKKIQNRLIAAQSDLRENKETLQFIFDNTIQGMVIHDETGAITFANKAAVSILGLSEAELLGRESIDPCWNCIHEDGSPFPGEEHPAMQSLKTGTPVYDTKMGVFNPANNTYTWINVNAVPRFRKYDEKPYQVIATFEDITAMLKSTNDLRKAKKEAEQSSRLKTAFLHNLSHEIRTPMNSIMGFTKMLERPNLKEAERQKYRNIITENAGKLLNVINDVLIISSLEKKLEKVYIEDLSLTDIIKDIQAKFKPEFDRKAVDLRIDEKLLNQPVCFRTDKEKLSEILSRVISNALKFTETGFVELNCKLDNSEEKQIIFSVIDSGVGIEYEKQKAVFDEFQKGDTNNHAQNEGIGLGLAIVKAFSELLGGTVKLHSTPGTGTEFRLFLPYQPCKAEEHKLESEPTDKKTVLIAEDETDNFIYMEALLADFNVEVLRACNGKEAVEICKKNTKINLVLMDIRMPELNGYSAAEQIKVFRPDLPIIAQTAYAPIGSKSDYDLPYFDDFIRKPIDEVHFYELLTKFLF